MKQIDAAAKARNAGISKQERRRLSRGDSYFEVAAARFLQDADALLPINQIGISTVSQVSHVVAGRAQAFDKVAALLPEYVEARLFRFILPLISKVGLAHLILQVLPWVLPTPTLARVRTVCASVIVRDHLPKMTVDIDQPDVAFRLSFPDDDVRGDGQTMTAACANLRVELANRIRSDFDKYLTTYVSDQTVGYETPPTIRGLRVETDDE